MGMLVLPTLKELIKDDDEGKKKPIPMPTNMAAKIQSVRKRSRKESFLVDIIGNQSVQNSS